MIGGNYVAHVTPAARMLGDGQKVQVHQATLELLRRTGVRVIVPDVRDLLAKAGCWVDGDRVRIPSNLIHDVGYIESGLTTSYEMLVSMDEIAGLVKRLMRGVEITDETLALDVIDRVGPGGHFLEERHTLRHFRENWFPRLLDRGNVSEWDAEGRLTLGDRTAARVREIFESHEPLPLEEVVADRLAAVIQRAEERVRRSES